MLSSLTSFLLDFRDNFPFSAPQLILVESQSILHHLVLFVLSFSLSFLLFSFTLLFSTHSFFFLILFVVFPQTFQFCLHGLHHVYQILFFNLGIVSFFFRSFSGLFFFLFFELRRFILFFSYLSDSRLFSFCFSYHHIRLTIQLHCYNRLHLKYPLHHLTRVDLSSSSFSFLTF